MKLTYKGKSAIITGACGGMGLETTKKLISNNINTLMLDIKKPPKDFLNQNRKATFKQIDITNFKKFLGGFFKSIISTAILFLDKFLETSKPIPPQAPVTIADLPL